MRPGDKSTPRNSAGRQKNASSRSAVGLAGLAVAALLAAIVLTACRVPQPDEGGDGSVDNEPAPVLSQDLLLPGEPVEGSLDAEEVDRWIFGTAGGRLATVEVWFRPSSASGPEAGVEALLTGPDGATVAAATGTVTLPPYIVEQELSQTGSYLLQLKARSGAPGRYTLLVTLSAERYLTRQDVYTGTLSLDGSPAQGVEWPAGSWGFVWPSPRRAVSGWYFHDPGNPTHNGLDIAADLYDPLVAVADGTVAFADVSGGYGNLVVLDHADGWQSWYAHLSLFSVAPGQMVKQGEMIGSAGSTGYSTGPHLHLELRYQGQPVDPLVYLE